MKIRLCCAQLRARFSDGACSALLLLVLFTMSFGMRMQTNDDGQNTPARAQEVDHALAPRITVAALTVPSADDENPHDFAGLRNVVAFNRELISGSVPEGAAGFESLVALGIKTIISVDGATPDLARAGAVGLRIVHLPIGYDGFDDARKAELVRAVRDLAKPIYIHCHHGKHRSAAAAGAIAVSLGWFSQAQAAARMKVSGTAAGYPGLWSCVANSAVMSNAQIDAARDEFPAITRGSNLVDAMVELDEILDRLKHGQPSGVIASSAESDSVNAHSPLADASLLADRLRTLTLDAADDSSAVHSASGGVERVRWSDQQRALFQRHLAESVARAATFESVIAAAEKGRVSAREAESGEALRALSASCVACHKALRDARER